MGQIALLTRLIQGQDKIFHFMLDNTLK